MPDWGVDGRNKSGRDGLENTNGWKSSGGTAAVRTIGLATCPDPIFVSTGRLFSTALILTQTFDSAPLSALAMHLKNASEARLERVHRQRPYGFPMRFRYIGIAPAAAPQALARDFGALLSGFRQRPEQTSALSLLYWDVTVI